MHMVTRAPPGCKCAAGLVTGVRASAAFISPVQPETPVLRRGSELHQAAVSAGYHGLSILDQATDLRPHCIRLTAPCPGNVDTAEKHLGNFALTGASRARVMDAEELDPAGHPPIARKKSRRETPMPAQVKEPGQGQHDRFDLHDAGQPIAQQYRSWSAQRTGIDLKPDVSAAVRQDGLLNASLVDYEGHPALEHRRIDAFRVIGRGRNGVDMKDGRIERRTPDQPRVRRCHGRMLGESEAPTGWHRSFERAEDSPYENTSSCIGRRDGATPT